MPLNRLLRTGAILNLERMIPVRALRSEQGLRSDPHMDEFRAAAPLPTRDDLASRFPRRFRVVFARSFYFLLAGLTAVVGLIISLFVDNPGDSEVVSAAISAFQWFLLGVLAVVMLRIIYEIVAHLMFEYSIELEHLNIVQGIFFRSRASFPIARLNDVSIQRTPVEMLFGLYSIKVLTASPIGLYGAIDGLSRHDAVGLQSLILALVETTLPNVRERSAHRVIAEDLTPEEADREIHGTHS